MTEWVEAYLRQLRVWNYSAETIEGHERRLECLCDYLLTKGLKTPLEATREHLAGFQVWLYERINAKGKTNQPQSLNNNLSVVKVFYGWLYAEGRVAVDPAKSLRYAKTPQLLPKTILTTTEVRQIIHACDTTTLLGYRDRAMVEVLYGSGVRKGELRKLRLGDVDLEGRVIHVRRGKGNKDRTVPMTKIAARYLAHYLATVRPRLLDGREDGGWVFVSREANSIGRTLVNDMLTKQTKAAGLGKAVHPHALRAACITHMLRNQSNAKQNILRPVMELSGHANLQSLHHYTATDITELREVHAKTHPRELEAT